MLFELGIDKVEVVCEVMKVMEMGRLGEFSSISVYLELGERNVFLVQEVIFIVIVFISFFGML